MKNKIAACTIVSNNYIAYAKTLADSFKENNIDKDFYILIVDQYDRTLAINNEDYDIIELQELNIENFQSIVFQFDILELNTNVKPTFLKYLLLEKKYEQAIYFDPDIYIYKNIDYIVQLLGQYSLVITPHCNTPYPNDGLKPDDQSLLKSGVFNLGFIGAANSEDGINLLSWWEKKCLTSGFNEPSNGLFVDQKWINFAPCFSNSMYVLKDVGHNMAYWNLHERTLGKKHGKYIVNNESELVFFHFSGINVNDEDLLSKYQNRYHLLYRKDLSDIFKAYREKVKSNGMEQYKNILYFYSHYSNGEIIPSLARRLYSRYKEDFKNIDPFDANGDFYRWLKSQNITSEIEHSNKYNSLNYDKYDLRIKMIHATFKIILKFFGVDKYMMLMKYLSWISILRNQKEIFKL